MKANYFYRVSFCIDGEKRTQNGVASTPRPIENDEDFQVLYDWVCKKLDEQFFSGLSRVKIKTISRL